jgi:hypothetical protein
MVAEIVQMQERKKKIGFMQPTRSLLPIITLAFSFPPVWDKRNGNKAFQGDMIPRI